MYMYLYTYIYARAFFLGTAPQLALEVLSPCSLALAHVAPTSGYNSKLCSNAMHLLKRCSKPYFEAIFVWGQNDPLHSRIRMFGAEPNHVFSLVNLNGSDSTSESLTSFGA